MKKFLIILLFPLVFNAQRDYSDALHYYSGFAISFIIGDIVWEITDNNTISLSTGLTAGIGAGIFKEEVYDRQLGLGTPSLEDKLITGWGACGGALSLRIRIGIYDKRQRESKKTRKLINLFE